MASGRMCGYLEVLRVLRSRRQVQPPLRQNLGAGIQPQLTCLEFHSVSQNSYWLRGPQWKRPLGISLFPARQRGKVSPCVYHLGPTPRCLSTSTALFAESQVQTSPVLPSTPSPTSVTEVVPGGAADAVQAAAEQSLSDLGLGGFTPVGLVQNLLEFVHVDLGLPWWGAIVTCTVFARIMIFPLIVKGQREAVKINNHMPEIHKFSNRMNEAKLSGDKFEFSRAFSELQLYQKKHDVSPMRGFIVPLAQAPIFISFFIALREMAYLPVPSMQNGGLWWFQDLTAADPLYALPLLVTASMWAILELGAETGVNNANLRMMKTVFRVLPLIVLPFTINFPTAVFTYWFSSNLFSLAQVSFLQIPAVRIWLRIPKRITHEPNQLPTQEGLIKSIKTGWKNAQTAHQLKERERRMRDHLQLAARGPLRQTFTHNPLLQPEGKQPPTTTSTSNKPKSQKPWRDTLG
ncbi:mitochondrial inner membrane protein OXA1L isoform X1 [Gracilinanus agilis]|uniref:mitochondrial inner membrane protein OXA1L isoform X1 n=1 Tax=Gracilinanus agilis TaxID=191870 RepID=UPI001CFE30D9|nr:mitochondrial inner membrane protein OXA1L isoform X1 [Gracilinanus agilis]